MCVYCKAPVATSATCPAHPGERCITDLLRVRARVCAILGAAFTRPPRVDALERRDPGEWLAIDPKRGPSGVAMACFASCPVQDRLRTAQSKSRWVANLKLLEQSRFVLTCSHPVLERT